MGRAGVGAVCEFCCLLKRIARCFVAFDDVVSIVVVVVVDDDDDVIVFCL